MPHRFYTVDVFTDTAFNGNPLAVFPEATGLNTAQMQQIAKEFNLSETVFIQPATNTNTNLTKALRIFTPQKELPFAGHPIIGSAFVLAELGLLPLKTLPSCFQFALPIGMVNIQIWHEHGKVTKTGFEMQPKLIAKPSMLPVTEVAKVLKLTTAEVLRMQVVSCGTPFLMVEVKDLATINKAVAPIQLPWPEQYLIYLFCFETIHAENQIHARMFGCEAGIVEDAATGSAAVALVAWLSEQQTKTEFCLRIEQGFALGRPSLIEAYGRVKKGVCETVAIQGQSVLFAEGQLYPTTV